MALMMFTGCTYPVLVRPGPGSTTFTEEQLKALVGFDGHLFRIVLENGSILICRPILHSDELPNMQATSIAGNASHGPLYGNVIVASPKELA